MQIVKISLGANGSFAITESGGTVTLDLEWTEPNTGCNLSAKFNGPLPGVLALAAGHSTNATVKMILTDMAAAAKMLPVDSAPAAAPVAAS